MTEIELTATGVPRKYHRFVRIFYQIRATSFAVLFVALGVQMWGRGYGGIAWVLLALQFLAYPHLLFWRARRARDSLNAEHANLLLDCLLLGIWVAALQYPTWIAFPIFLGTSLNNAVNRGWRGAAGALLAFACGALAWGFLAGFEISPHTNLASALICLIGLSVYVVGLGTIVFAQSRKLRDTREALRQREEHYRIITENAGDLIAMLDAEGRWVYANPAYRRLLDETVLQTGADAYACVHPEDRDATRALLEKAVRSGEAQEFLYRLIGTQGSEREFRAKAKSFLHAGTPRIVVVSTDVTELRQRDKKLAVQADVFENMTEAMMIVAADGTVLSVNRAYTAVTGYSAEEVCGKSESGFRTALQPAEFYDQIEQALERQGHWSGTFWCRRKDASIYREWRNISAIRDAAGRVTHTVVFFADVSQSAHADRAIAH
ncbi:MAG: PAS domain S-box protein [Burkholderiales bacterium]|nr:PAS domain S-box protein [Burkholderiales bacterium]